MEQQQQQRGLLGFSPARPAACRAGGSAGQAPMRLSITSTTGSPVELTVPRGETVEGLRTRVSQKLRLQTDRILLLHRDRQLNAGKLLDLGVADGSKLTLVPVIEAGLVCSSARAERTVMDVLESLTDIQISDFLSGHSPLTINLGIGGHVMYVQLQLSAQDVKNLQLDEDVRIQSSSELQTGLPMAAGTSHSGSASSWSSTKTPGSTTSQPASQTSIPAPKTASDSTSQIQLDPQRPKTSLNPTASSPHSSTTVPAVNCHRHASLPQSYHPAHTPPPVLPTASLPSGCPHSSCPLQAATPICSPAPTGSSPGPPSPVLASTFQRRNAHTSPTELCKQPGAVIESFVSPSPGVFSGTFSGSLGPHSQSSISHPRRGIAIILQILNDLLRAADYHQGAPPAPPQHYPGSNHPVSPVSPAQELSNKRTRSKPPVAEREEQFSKASGEDTPSLHSSTEEDQTLQSKLERLQFLMHQRRLRRRIRRNSHLSQTSHLYQHRHHRP